MFSKYQRKLLHFSRFRSSRRSLTSPAIAFRAPVFVVCVDEYKIRKTLTQKNIYTNVKRSTKRLVGTVSSEEFQFGLNNTNTRWVSITVEMFY